MTFGFTLAFLSMVFFGLYMVPNKYCRLRSLEFVLSMGGGVVLTSAVAWGLARPDNPLRLAPVTLALAFLCGPVWTLGMIAFTIAVGEIGLTLSTPIKNVTAVLGTLIGLVSFGETLHTDAWLALIGSGLIVLCAVVIGKAGEASDLHYTLTGRGILFSLLAAFFFAAYTYPLKLAMIRGMDSYSIVVLMGIGTVFTAGVGHLLHGGTLTHWWKEPVTDHLYAVLAGSLWALATLLMNAAIARIGLAVTWPLTNLNTVIAVLIGAYVFHEIHLEKHWKRLVIGMAYAAAGVLLLGLSKR